MQQKVKRGFAVTVCLVTSIAVMLAAGCAPKQVINHYIMGLIQQADTLFLGFDLKAHHISVCYDRLQEVCRTYENDACAALAEQYGDTHYQKKVYEWEVPYREDAWVFCSDRVDSVRVRAAVDIAGRPAGTSLNDAFYVLSVTPDGYIRNGYHRDEEEYARVESRMPSYIRQRWVTRTEDYSSVESTLMPIFGRLDQVDFSRYALIGWHDRLMDLYPIVELPSEDIGLEVHVYFSSGREVVAVRYAEGG